MENVNIVKKHRLLHFYLRFEIPVSDSQNLSVGVKGTQSNSLRQTKHILLRSSVFLQKPLTVVIKHKAMHALLTVIVVKM